MAHQQRAIAQNIVDVFIAINIIDFAALATDNEGRHATHATEGAHRAVNATRNVLACFLKSGSGFIMIHNSSPFLTQDWREGIRCEERRQRRINNTPRSRDEADDALSPVLF